MIKVFEDYDIAQVGHYQSMLESSGIDTFMKNRFGTSGSGELPFVEVVPQLWVLNDADEQRARALIDEMMNADEASRGKEWLCSGCGTAQGGAFTHCWKCSAARPAASDADP